MNKLSKRFMYYCGLLAGHMDNPNINVDDLKHIQNLIDLEEQGLLLKLPCEIGKRVYQIYRFCDEGAWEIDVHKIRLEDLELIGKTVFLTQAEAEEALKRMEREE